MISCTTLLAETRAEYTSVPLETQDGTVVELRNLLLLSEKGLASARVLLADIGGDGDGKGKKAKTSRDIDTLLPRFRDLLLLLSDNPEALSAEMEDWPTGMYIRVINAWQEATDAGEATHSDS